MLNQEFIPRLADENHEFQGTGGVSANNFSYGFAPAFRDSRTGKVEVSRFSDGRPAPFHLLDGLPDEWVLERESDGRVVEIKTTIVSGFVRLDRFYTRQEAADFVG